ncbi:pyruvate ferredoxin oxidoreductase [Exilibacterium tricleocarpae]|uniref:Pyruvate ferredoxin oxidoreductase n=2 Tax=Exilibacterium tricleocarpae TaxID=2591008 RepID=A0A545UA28_9GAMM|nr:pyruvate ferredoxin oxidoreductase [Exilibacterium tricleocarpae]
MDGNTAVIMCERESSDAAGAYPITPSTQMGEMWAQATAQGHINMSGRPLIFIEPEGEHAAAAVTAGMAMSGLRAANFSSGQGIAYMHESLYAAVGKRLTYVLNIGARAMTKATLNVHAGHDDYHCVDDTGFFQMFAANAQQAADLNIIAHRIAELALTPGIVAQDGFLTTHLIESLLLPEPALIAEYLGRPDDIIDTPTPAQKIIYGDTRRRIPELWDVDNPVMAGVVQNQDAYMQSVAAQRPFFFDPLKELTEQALSQFYELTGRRYARVQGYRHDDADYLIVGQGSLVPNAEAVADYLRDSRGLKVGVVNLLMFRPFPADLLSLMLKGKKGVVVLERLDQPLAVDLPLMREIRAAVSQCIENGKGDKAAPHPELAHYKKMTDIPDLYSGSFGLGSRDLQPEGLIAAVENMLPAGRQKKHVYLSIDFLHEQASTPKQDVYQQTLADAYPELRELAIRGSENPNLMPAQSITVRFHSVGGWGAITTGKNLAMTLFELLGYHIKANPKYGSEKKGQPTTYYLSAAPEPIRVNSEYFYVDVVLSPDPNVFHHTNALAGLREGGIFIIQSDKPSPQRVWAAIPEHYQQMIVDKHIRLFYLDAFKIAREEATDPDLQLRMQGTAFQGAFFAAAPVMSQSGFTEEKLLAAIRAQLQHKFGDKGARVVEENVRVVQRGFDELQEILDQPIGVQALSLVERHSEPSLPIMVKKLPQSGAAATDIHRFWEQTGSFYARGQGSDNLADPFIGLGVMPAASALFRDMTGIRFEHPQFIGENCTGCGDCYTVCPDTAIPGLVNEVSQVLDTVVTRVKKNGHPLKYLPRAVRALEPVFRERLNQAEEADSVGPMLHEAIEKTVGDYRLADGTALADAQKAELKQEFNLFEEALDGFQFALTRPYYTLHERQQVGTGGLLSITVNPYTCKGCMECVAVCGDDALRPVTQTDESVKQLKENWAFWLDLPNTPDNYIRVDNLEEGIGALETILLDKESYLGLTSGDGACLGCSEKTALHLFIATVESLMRPRVARHLAYLDELLQKLEQHIQLKLVQAVNIDDTESMAKVLKARVSNGKSEDDLTLADIAAQMEDLTGSQPIDPAWLEKMTQLVAKLKDLKWRYTEGTSGKGRANMGILNATGCSSVWGSTYPFNPYPFPWANHLFQDSASLAMGVFEGHMAKMAEGFKAIRCAELEVAGNYNPAEHDEFFTYFDWQAFSDEEFQLCPPVVAVGGDGAMYDIGFQNLSRAMMSGKPLKVVILDTQAYSNTGGQACTSGFFSQISDMAEFGKVIKGKQEARKEIGLIAMAHRTTYVMQSTIANANHMIEGFIEGLMTRRPALFNLYTSCQPEHGIGDDMGHRQAKLAVESRAYPLFRYNPDNGKTPAECFDLERNPAIDDLWPRYSLKYLEGGREKTLDVPMTFADFAMTEARFRKHFRTAPPDTWHENMVPLADFLELPEADREGQYPFIWTVDREQRLSRLLVAKAMVESCEDRRDFWILLKAVAGVARKQTPPAADLEDKIRRQVVSKLTDGLLKLAGAEAAPATAGAAVAAAAGPAIDTVPAVSVDADTATYMAPWIDTEECTACDECTNLNPGIFAYNDAKKAYIKNPLAGPYKDLVKAAEKCTARIIHPGLPGDRSAKDIDKWIKRGEKFN